MAQQAAFESEHNLVDPFGNKGDKNNDLKY